MIHPYRESVLSQLYPGYQHSSNCLVPAVLTFEQVLNLPAQHRSKCIWRIDQGFGGDANINWLLKRDYQVLGKGCSNRRAAKLAQVVQRWRPVAADKFVGRPPTPEEFARPVETFVIRYHVPKGWKHAYLFSTLNQSGVVTVRFYDQRGGAETGFRSDKSGGLHLHKRRKHKRDAQEVWVLLTDMNHNYLSWFAHNILAESPFADYGFLRISRDLFRIPGYVEMENGQLLSVKLLRSSPYAADLLDCLRRFWE
jgi:hypothetical protein